MSAEAAAQPSGYIADTSVFIAAEQRRPLGTPPPGDARISVATLTELRLGELRATGEPLRTLRAATLERARRFIALPYDEAIANTLALILSTAREQKRSAGAMDAIIAATALTHGLVVWTQDHDFDVLSSLVPELVVTQG